MAILLVIPFLAGMCITMFLLAIKRQWKSALTILLIVVVTNTLSETFPLNFRYFNKKKSGEITVLVYNVHGFDEEYCDKQVDIAQTIISESPDVVFLCEFPLYKSFVLDSILTKDYEYTQYYQDGTFSVFYSKFKIDSVAHINSLSSKKLCLPNLVYASVGEDTLALVGCHLSSSNNHIRKGYQNRRYESESIYETINKESHPIIVMGDLNDISGSYTIEHIKDAGLKDAWWRGGFGYGATFHERWIKLRLDHILYQESKLDLQYVKRIESKLSDHNALVASLKMQH